MRYLSHAEMMRVFQRACVRAGIKVAYSQGFNPHQRLSLVLPRSVGVESDDEMLCLKLEEGQTSFDADALKKELPAGIEVISAQTSRQISIPEPKSARYMIKIKKELSEDTREQIKGLLDKEEIWIKRRTGEDERIKLVNVRPFLESINVEAENVAVECNISPEGTIRVDEILDLLGLKIGDLDRPVRRVSVQYSEFRIKN